MPTKTVNKKVFDGVVKVESFMLRYSEKQATAIAKRALEAMDLARVMQEASEIKKDKKRYGIIYNRLAEMYRSASEKTLKDYSDVAKELAGMTTGGIRGVVEDSVPFQFSMRTPTPGQILNAAMATPMTSQGWMVKDAIMQWGAGASRMISKTIADGYLVGMTAQEVKDRIMGREELNFKDGAVSSQEHSLERIVRTALQHLEGTARTLMYQQNEEILDGTMFVATLDAETCMECAMLDGKVYELGKGMEPPIHWNCRCTTVPVVKSWTDLGAKFDPGEWSREARASMDGQVSGKITYSEWIKQKEAESPGFAKGPLGGARYEMFKAGKWEPTTFDPKDGVYTVEQIKTLLDYRK